ncbi:O-antigen ligase family protein [Myxococcota bacterium]
MLVIPGLFSLLVFILARPFDFVPALREIPFLYIFFGLAVLGYLADLAQGKTRWQSGPLLSWVIAFFGWCVLNVIVRASWTLSTAIVSLLITVSLYFLSAHGITTLAGFSRLATLFLGCTVAISAVCVHLSQQPLQCVELDPSGVRSGPVKPDGRSCEGALECYEDAPDLETEYGCERLGLGGVSTIQGRVRYLGVLHDPNEAALTVSLGIPLAIAGYQRRRSLWRLAVLGVAVVLAGITVVASQSRGGQLVFLAVLAVYFLRRYRWKGMGFMVVMGLPVLLLGGRSGGSAEESATERLDCIAEGLQMFGRTPVLGVGFGQFTEYHPLTAHNSFVLAPAELGVFGMVTWSMLLWIAMKTSWVAINTLGGADTEEARTWAMAMFATGAGVVVGVMFLSFNYHYVFWSFLGLAGALHAAVARRHPGWRVSVGGKDVALVILGNSVLLSTLYAYARLKGVG